MSFERKSFAPLLLAAAAAAPIVSPSVASADPVWPVAGAESADRTIRDLEDQGYMVQINWVGGNSITSLALCRVNAINNPDRSFDSPPPQNTTVYVDVWCPHDWDREWGSFGVGFGF